MISQRVGHGLATEQQHIILIIDIMVYHGKIKNYNPRTSLAVLRLRLYVSNAGSQVQSLVGN